MLIGGIKTQIKSSKLLIYVCTKQMGTPYIILCMVLIALGIVCIFLRPPIIEGITIDATDFLLDLTGATFSQSVLDMEVAPSGIVYFVDAGKHTVFQISTSGVVSVLAGSGSPAYTDGVGGAASFNLPVSIAVGPDSNIYVADALNSAIRKITPSGTVSTLISRIGKTPVSLGVPFAPILAAPYNIAIDSNGIIYVAGSGLGVMQLVGSTNPTIRVLPIGFKIDSAGNMYKDEDIILNGTKYTYSILKGGNSMVVMNNISSTVAAMQWANGIVGGLAVGDMHIDNNNNLYIFEAKDPNNARGIKYTPAGVITTVVNNSMIDPVKDGILADMKVDTEGGIYSYAKMQGRTYHHILTLLDPKTNSMGVPPGTYINTPVFKTSGGDKLRNPNNILKNGLVSKIKKPGVVYILAGPSPAILQKTTLILKADEPPAPVPNPPIPRPPPPPPIPYKFKRCIGWSQQDNINIVNPLCPPGSSSPVGPGRCHSPDMRKAQIACDDDARCAGIVKDPYGYEPRRNGKRTMRFTGVTSWQCITDTPYKPPPREPCPKGLHSAQCNCP
jgi:hypothetical protein